MADPTPKNAFNARSPHTQNLRGGGGAPPRNPAASAALLARIDQLQKTLELPEAVAAKDWTRAEKLLKEGADPGLRGGRALQALAASGALEAAKLARTLDDPPVNALVAMPLASAAEQGRRDTLDYLLAKAPAEGMLEIALAGALRGRQKDIADELYGQLRHAELGDATLVEMLLHRPELYAQATAARKTPPDYILHFIKACESKDIGAMNRAIDAMAAHRDSFGPSIEAHKQEFEIGMGHQEALTALLMTGDAPTMARYYATFPELCPTNLEGFMIFSLAVSPPESEVMRPIVDAFRPSPQLADWAFSYAAQTNRAQSLEYLARAYPELAKKNAKTVLAGLAARKTPEAFFTALQDGYELPVKNDEKAEILAEALTSGNTAAAAHVEAAMLPTLNAVLRLQAFHDVKVLKRAAELGGDWHFRDDVLFWRALETGDRATLAAVPSDAALSTAQLSQVTSALNAAIRRGDFDLVQTAMQRGNWTPAAREESFKACLAHPEALKAFDFMRFPPRVLSPEDLAAVAGGADGAATLTLLKTRGFVAQPAAALQAAVEKNAPGMAEYLLARGADLAAAAPLLAGALEREAQAPMLALLGKWAARGRDLAPPADLDARIAAGPAETVFSGPVGETDSPAIAAAYAGRFSDVMKKAAAMGADFDPSLFVAAKDSRGNTLLDILGAHGRLNDVLAPEIWAGRDAKAFLEAHAAPCYLGQCDFAGLQAAIVQQRLKALPKTPRIGGIKGTFRGPFPPPFRDV
jgi:hypothetical protein